MLYRPTHLSELFDAAAKFWTPTREKLPKPISETITVIGLLFPSLNPGAPFALYDEDDEDGSSQIRIKKLRLPPIIVRNSCLETLHEEKLLSAPLATGRPLTLNSNGTELAKRYFEPEVASLLLVQ